MSIWSPLRHPAFRGLWTSGGIYFVGNAMQTMAAAWLMVEITGSSFLAALVQTAGFLPMFVLSLPAGGLARNAHPRRPILGTPGTPDRVARPPAPVAALRWGPAG